MKYFFLLVNVMHSQVRSEQPKQSTPPDMLIASVPSFLVFLTPKYRELSNKFAQSLEDPIGQGHNLYKRPLWLGWTKERNFREVGLMCLTLFADLVRIKLVWLQLI